MLALDFTIQEKNGIRRIQEPVVFGLPFPQGMVVDPSALILCHADGAEISLQAHVTTRWGDQSVMWVLLEFQVDAQPLEIVSYRLECGEGSVATPQDSLLVFREKEGQYFVETGAASFVLDSKVFSPFNSVLLHGSEVLDQGETSFFLTDKDGQKIQADISSMEVECQGPVRLTLRFEGEFGKEKSNSPRFMARVDFFAGSGLVRLTFTLHNPHAAIHPRGCWDLGDAGSLYFNDLTWAIGTRASQSIMRGGNAMPQGEWLPQNLSNVEIRQHSSGGENWQSVNHVNDEGNVPLKIAGYQVKGDGEIIMEGKRATPVLFLKTEARTIMGTLKDFWQNFPKALEVDNRQIILHFFPQQADELYELQGGEQKTHIGVLTFTDHAVADPKLDWVHAPLRPAINSEWYAASGAIRYLSPRNTEQEKPYGELIDAAIRSPNSWIERREIIDEYGWRNFGEIYADHEAVNSEEKSSFISHYNNQYDGVWGLFIEYCRTGNEQWFVLMNDLAKHVIDIDIYHTQEDRTAYNGGLFWHTDHYATAQTATHRTYSSRNDSHGGGPSNEHNYTSGLLHYYFLTGDVLAAAAVQSLADWVINMDDPRGTFLGSWDRRPTGRASSTVERGFHGPGRGGGNSINALLDAFALTRKDLYLKKAEELIKRCIHPDDDIDRHHLQDAEHRWSYTVFLVALGKYADLKVVEAELDVSYAYARSALLHYAAWMVEHEVPYSKILDQVEIPTETWSAQDMRKSHVLNVAGKYAEEPLRSLCQKKAKFFYDACLRDLQAFDTADLTRPIILLLTNGFVQAYADRHPEEAAPLLRQGYDFGSPQNFRSQGDELYITKEWLSDIPISLKKWGASICDEKIRKGSSP